MNTREKYDSLIEAIENGVSDHYTDALTLSKNIAREQLMSQRDLNVLMQYMTGLTVLAYIKQRKMNAAYRYIIESKRYNASAAEAISGYDNQSSFGVKFSKVYGMTPTEAFEKKDHSLLTPPMTWAVISQGSNCCEHNETEESHMEETKYGVPVNVYDMVMGIHTLEELYQLPPIYERLAQRLWRELKLTPEDAFRYADAVFEYCGENLDEDIEEFMNDPGFIADPEERLFAVANDAYNRFIFFHCDLSLEAGYEIEYATGFSYSTIMNEPPEILHYYAPRTYGDHIHYKYFKDAFLYFKDHANDDYDEEDFENYLNAISCSIPKEIAFAEVVPRAVRDSEEDALGGFEELMEDGGYPLEYEETTWEGDRFDSDYDEENPDYDDDD